MQGVDDRNPYIFLFGGLPSTQGVTLTITGSVLMSQCGGQRASHVDQMLSMAFPDARKETDEIVRSSVSYNSFAPLDLPSPAGVMLQHSVFVLLLAQILLKFWVSPKRLS